MLNAYAKNSLLVLAGAVLTLVACSKKDDAPPTTAEDSMMASMALEGALEIVAWPGYVERGESDKAYDWVTQFEADTGCKVTVKTASTSDEMIALMASGGPPPSPPGDASWPPAGNAPYDLVIAAGDAALRLIRGGTVQPIGLDRIPSYATIDPRLRQASWHTVDGKHWGVPFQWRPNVLMYDAKAFAGTPPTSWSVVFETQKLPDGRPNKGRVQAYGSPIYIADAALYLMAKKPGLGIKDPYELNEVQYAAVLDLLRDQRPLIQRYWLDADAQVRDFQNEGVAASGSWPFQADTLLANKADVGTVLPTEGATGWADTTMLAAGAPHPNCAYKWLEWSISPKVQGDVAASIGSNPVVPNACESNELLGADGCRKGRIDDFDRIRFWRTPEAKCGSGADACVPYDRWITDYAAIVAGK